ncbi:MAG: hypothetical protein ABSF71_10945 [Terriglobia bacterium]|jgi:hypothetical protein
MTRILQQTMIVVFIGGCVLMASRNAGAQLIPAATVAVALEKTVVTQHEPVLLRFTLSNSSSKQADFELGYGEEKANIKVNVTDPDGRVWPKPRPAPRFGAQFREAILAEPYTTSVGSVVLDDWFTFNKLGKYRIDVAVPPSKDSSPADLQVPETPLTLSVVPRDQDALASACAGLVTRVENWKSASDADVAADALSKIDDPVAVPFLAQAMKQKFFSSMMIDSLARLNTPDAVNAFVAASQSSDPEISAAAYAALVALGKVKPPG